MSWIPSFITPLAGLIAAVLSISALLVLYFLKLRRREMLVSSTILWRKAVQDLQVNAPFQKLRRNLLLLLQLLLLIALCLALMRPVANFKRGAGKLTVILIDRSGSMAAKDVANGKRTRLEEAKRLALEVVASMKRDDNACVISFDETAETLCPLTPDAAKLRLAIDGIEQTDRKSKLKLAYQLAEAQSAFIPEQNRANVKPDVFLYSDGRATDSQSLTLRGNLTFGKIGDDKTGNIAIVALSAKRNYENPTEVQVFARLANYGPEVVEADVNLSVATEFAGGLPTYQIRSSAHTKLLPERWSDAEREAADKAGTRDQNSVEFKLDLTTSAVLRLEQMHKEGDALAADDVAQVVVPPPKALSVLLVTDSNFFLEKLKGSIQLKEFDILSPASYEDAKPVKYDVIMFDQYQPKFMPQAGNFMWFRALPPNAKVKQAMNGVRPVYTQENTILDWKRDHPMLAGLNLGKLYIESAMKLEVPPVGVERLIEGSKGPLVVLDREGRSTHLIVGFDVLQSNWPLKLSFPIYMYQALQYLALGSEMDVREAFPPGATPTIPLGDIKRVAADRKEIHLTGPGGTRTIKIPEAGDFVLPPLDRVGLYTLDVPVPGYDKMAVNLLDSNESNLIPSDHPPGDIGDTQVTTGRARVELWWWLAALGVPLLLIEWFVYTRRVHL
ncbi:MAG: hypothetical protein JWN40_3881 [Phycisphaerales bacterium]|nr:hypothetical protein [Phycisphaerales bacterium]